MSSWHSNVQWHHVAFKCPVAPVTSSGARLHLVAVRSHSWPAAGFPNLGMRLYVLGMRMRVRVIKSKSDSESESKSESDSKS